MKSSSFLFLVLSFVSSAVWSDSVDRLLKRNACELVVVDQTKQEKVAQVRLAKSMKSSEGSFALSFNLDPLTKLYPEFQHHIEIHFFNLEEQGNSGEMEVIVRKKGFVRNWNSVAKTQGRRSFDNFKFEFEELSGDRSPRIYQINCNRLPA